MAIFPRDTRLGVCPDKKKKKIHFTSTRWKRLGNCGWKIDHVWDGHLHKISIIKGTSVLADMEDSHKIKIPDDLRYYYKSLGVPQVILLLCEWSFSLHLLSSFALTQTVEAVEDICMLNYCVKNVCRYRSTTSPIDFFWCLGACVKLQLIYLQLQLPAVILLIYLHIYFSA